LRDTMSLILALVRRRLTRLLATRLLERLRLAARLTNTPVVLGICGGCGVREGSSPEADFRFYTLQTPVGYSGYKR
jgi:hypothetical protein